LFSFSDVRKAVLLWFLVVVSVKLGRPHIVHHTVELKQARKFVVCRGYLVAKMLLDVSPTSELSPWRTAGCGLSSSATPVLEVKHLPACSNRFNLVLT
jgi:hypothetical protein